MLSHAMPVQWQRSGSGPSLWPHAPCSQHQSCHTRRVVAFRAWRDWLSSVVGPDQSGPQQTGTAPSPTLPPEVAVPPLPPRRDFLEARHVPCRLGQHIQFMCSVACLPTCRLPCLPAKLLYLPVCTGRCHCINFSMGLSTSSTSLLTSATTGKPC